MLEPKFHHDTNYWEIVMIKKKLSSKCLLLMSIPAVSMIILICWTEAISIIHLLKSANYAELYFPIIMLSFMGCFLVFLLFVINRFSCIVWIDFKNKVIGRKGLFGGFRYQLNVDQIKDVFVVSCPKQGDYIIIADACNQSVEGFSKKSFIRISDKWENREFIKQIWNEKK